MYFLNYGHLNDYLFTGIYSVITLKHNGGGDNEEIE